MCDRCQQLEREIEIGRALARAYFEHQFWQGYGQRLAAWAGYQHPCAEAPHSDTPEDTARLHTLAAAVNAGRAWED